MISATDKCLICHKDLLKHQPERGYVFYCDTKYWVRENGSSKVSNYYDSHFWYYMRPAGLISQFEASYGNLHISSLCTRARTITEFSYISEGGRFLGIHKELNYSIDEKELHKYIRNMVML